MASPLNAGLAIGSMIMSAAGAAVKAQGARYEGEAQAQMYQYQAGVADVNAKIARQNADYTRAVGEVNAQRQGQKTRWEEGVATATAAAGNIDVKTGSAMSVRDSMAAIGQQDQAIIRASAAKRAFGYEVEAFQHGAQADLYRMSAQKSRVAGMLGMESSLIGGAGSVADKWLQYKSNFGSSEQPSEDVGGGDSYEGP